MNGMSLCGHLEEDSAGVGAEVTNTPVFLCSVRFSTPLRQKAQGGSGKWARRALSLSGSLLLGHRTCGHKRTPSHQPWLCLVVADEHGDFYFPLYSTCIVF